MPVPIEVKFAPTVFKKRAKSKIVRRLRALKFGFFEVLTFVKIESFVTNDFPILLNGRELWKIGGVDNGFAGAALGKNIKQTIKGSKNRPTNLTNSLYAA